MFKIKTIKAMTKKENITLWAPRILCIGAILFVSMFALDSFGPRIPFGQQLLNFLMHLIPSFVLTLLLVIAWKRQLIGGILFTIAGIGFSPFVFMLNYNRTQSIETSLLIILVITIPFVIIGTLFIMGHYMKKEKP